MTFTYILIFLATLADCGETTSNTTLQLPITINPLFQDGIQQGGLTKHFYEPNAFFKHITFNDIVKSLGFDNRVVQLVKPFKSFAILSLAATAHGLTVHKFEFINASKWTIVMSAEELASVSNNITLPLNDEIRLITIQEAMYKSLEKRFNFKTEEIAERLNKTKDEIYAFLEPGWIQVVNFITEKNILALSTNYTIPPFYIAEALNMTLSELYNSTLPQLEDILVNKIDVIRAAAERWRQIVASSTAKLFRVSSTSFSSAASTMSPINTTIASVMMNITKTTAIRSKSVIQTETNTSSILSKISSRREISHTPTTTLTVTLDSRPVIVPQSSSMQRMHPPTTTLTVTLDSRPVIVPQSSSMQRMHPPTTTLTVTLDSRPVIVLQSSSMRSMNPPTTGIQNTILPSTNVESTTLPENQKSTSLSDKSFTSMYHAAGSTMATSTIPQYKWSPTSSYTDIQASTTQHHSLMFQSTTQESFSPNKTEMFSAITSKPSTASKNIDEILTSISSRGHSQKTSEDIQSSASYARTSEILVTQIMATSSSPKETTTDIMPTTTDIIPTTTDIIPTSVHKSSYASIRDDLSKSMTNTGPTISFAKAASDMVTVDAMESSSLAEKPRTSLIAITTSSYGKMRTGVSILPSTSQLTKSTQHFLESTKSSFSPSYPREISTNTKYQQSTNFLERSPVFTSKADGVTSKTSSSYHATSSYIEEVTRPSISYTQSISITTGNSLERSEDEIDPVVLIVVPILGFLFLIAVVLALIMWIRHRRRHKSAKQNNAESGSELSRKGLVESTDSIYRTTGFVNKGADDRSSRSMSRSSSMSNLETIHEGKEPDEPEIYHL